MAGTTIITEDPLIKVWGYDEVAWRYQDLSKEKKQAYDSLHHWVGIEKERIGGIFLTNRFALGRSSRAGVFFTCSRFNHACHPYATCTYAWDNEKQRMTVTTLRNINMGEELTISYMGYSVNQNSLQQNYGFQCDCPGCINS